MQSRNEAPALPKPINEHLTTSSYQSNTKLELLPSPGRKQCQQLLHFLMCQALSTPQLGSWTIPDSEGFRSIPPLPCTEKCRNRRSRFSLLYKCEGPEQRNHQTNQLQPASRKERRRSHSFFRAPSLAGNPPNTQIPATNPNAGLCLPIVTY